MPIDDPVPHSGARVDAPLLVDESSHSPLLSPLVIDVEIVSDEMTHSWHRQLSDRAWSLNSSSVAAQLIISPLLHVVCVRVSASLQSIVEHDRLPIRQERRHHLVEKALSQE